MTDNITFRYLEEKDIDQYIEIVKEFFGENYYGSKKEFLKWQYKDSPFQKDKDHYSIYAAFDNDKILAIDAFLAWKFYCEGKELDAVWDIEWLNNSKIKGLGRELVKQVATETELYCGYGYNSYSKNAYTKMDFRLNDEIERKIAFLNEERCLSLFENSENKEFISENIAPNPKKQYFLHTKIDSIGDFYWIDFLKNKKVVSYKGLDYLEWRFFNHPYIDYKIISSDQETKNGIAALRIETIKGHDDKIARIVDLMPVKGSESALIESIISFCLENDIIFIDFYCISYSISEEICPRPFISIKEHKKYDIPMLFQPMEIRERKSLNFVFNNNIDIEIIDEDIYATKADSDQDVFLNPDYKTVLL